MMSAFVKFSLVILLSAVTLAQGSIISAVYGVCPKTSDCPGKNPCYGAICPNYKDAICRPNCEECKPQFYTPYYEPIPDYRCPCPNNLIPATWKQNCIYTCPWPVSTPGSNLFCLPKGQYHRCVCPSYMVLNVLTYTCVPRDRCPLVKG